MTDLENLTDEQLRTKLIEHGFPVMPITGTTRKIMIKKLKILQDNRKKQAATDRRTLAKYSSDDDSESERKAKPRRATVAPVVKIRDAQNQVNGQEGLRSRKTPEKKTKVVKVQVQHTYSGETESDTEPEVVYATTKKRTSVGVQRNGMDYEAKEDTDEENSLGVNMTSFSSASSNTSCSVDSPPKLFTMAPRRHTPSVQRPEPLVPTATSAYAAFRSPISLGKQATSTPAEEHEDRGKPRARHTTYGYLNRNGDDPGLEDAPYLQNFSKRLSVLTQQARDGERAQRFKRVERHESGALAAGDAGGGFFARAKQKMARLFRRESRKRLATNTHCRTTSGPAKSEENTGNFVSLALVAAVGVFFVILVALYYGMHRGSNTNEIIGLQVPYCTSTVSTNCLTQEEATGGTDLYKIFKPKLIELAIEHQCGDLLTAPPANANNMKRRTFYMTDNDIVHFIKHNYKIQDEQAIRDDIDSFVTIAHHNRFLGVSVLMVDENSKDDGYLLIEDVKRANRDLESGLYIRAFAVLSPTLPWRCSFWQKVSALAKAVTVILSVAAVLHLAKFSYKRFRHYQHKRKEEVMMLVEKILEVMQTQSGDDQYLVINHVRDMIIPIDSRKRMEAAWKKALAFVEENESRVRAEVQIVKGESYEVWRWIGAQNVSMNCSASASKAWQGQAFEVQTPPCSPTPCLKVRGMIDDADRGCNKAAIREAILGKCAQSRVLHVAVDASAKCVYLKCADASDAGVAYRSLHGHWFAGHLVTVKYLRLERYMQRFPDSPVSGPPFLKV